MAKKARYASRFGSGSISQRHGSEDPDPYQKCHGSATLIIMSIRQWAYELTWSWDRHMSRARSQASHMGCWWVGGRGGLDTGLQSHDRRIRSANKKFLREKKYWFLKP
jgi:hypothetical protein